jgi:hypothetical protein
MKFTEISQRSKEVQFYYDKIKLLRDLHEGVNAMRHACLVNPEFNDYVNIGANETNDEFKKRILNRTDLLNATKMAVDNVVGRTFEKQAEIKTENKKLIPINSDMDLNGTSFNNFSKSVMTQGLWYGKSFIITDFDKKLNRPYSSVIDIENVLDVRYDKYMNIILFKIKINETFYPNIFSEEERESICFYYYDESGKVVFKKYSDVKGEAVMSSYNKDDEPTEIILDIDILPITEYYAETIKKGTLIDIPFMDIAEKNVVHFASTAEQRNILHYSRTPILVFSGVHHDKDGVSMDVSNAMEFRDPLAKVQWVEMGGKNLEEGNKDLLKLESEMDAMGAEMLLEASAKTATEVLIQTADTRTRGSMMSQNLVDAMNKVIQITAKWLDIKNMDEFEIYINTSVKMGISDIEFNLILQMKTLGIISDKTVREIAKIKGILLPEFDEDEEKDRLDEEGMFVSDIQRTSLLENDTEEEETQED